MPCEMPALRGRPAPSFLGRPPIFPAASLETVFRCRRLVPLMRFRWAAIVPIVACLGLLLVAPFHAVAYFSTPDGADSATAPLARVYAPALREELPGAFGFGEPHDVYVAYGRVTSVLIAAFALGLLPLREAHAPLTTRLQRWGFGLAIFGNTFVGLGAIVEYYTPFLDLAFVALALPGLLSTIVGYTVLGAALVRTRVVPRALAWLFAVSGPSIIALTALLGHIPFGFSLFGLTWLWAGVWLLRR